MAMVLIVKVCYIQLLSLLKRSLVAGEREQPLTDGECSFQAAVSIATAAAQLVIYSHILQLHFRSVRWLQGVLPSLSPLLKALKMRSEKECWAVLSLLQGLDGETVMRCVCVWQWLELERFVHNAVKVLARSITVSLAKSSHWNFSICFASECLSHGNGADSEGLLQLLSLLKRSLIGTDGKLPLTDGECSFHYCKLRSPLYLLRVCMA